MKACEEGGRMDVVLREAESVVKWGMKCRIFLAGNAGC